jgi:hypothetical protein
LVQKANGNWDSAIIVIVNSSFSSTILYNLYGSEAVENIKITVTPEDDSDEDAIPTAELALFNRLMPKAGNLIWLYSPSQFLNSLGVATNSNVRSNIHQTFENIKSNLYIKIFDPNQILTTI